MCFALINWFTSQNTTINKSWERDKVEENPQITKPARFRRNINKKKKKEKRKDWKRMNNEI
jgi:hypothetical protein